MSQKLLILIVICSFIAGCSSLKNNWDDFRAYYNTFYNAEEHFKEGVRSLQERPLTIDLRQPVRIHPPPVTADNESFEQAIQKCALILKRHEQSKWVDDALLLMGKSYYYLQQFSAAVDRFEQASELSSDKKIKQLAALWKGRALLDQKAFEEGISYLGQIIQEYPTGWSVQTIAELQSLLGEHHAMLENWGEAANYLSSAIDKIEDKSLLARTYFLYGQVLERQERYGEALFAFKKVSQLFPGFGYTYWAMLKQAEVNRKQGNLDEALGIYRRLHKNDKYTDQRNRLTYEIAYTLELQGKVAQAKDLYQDLLSDGGQPAADRTLRARIHYRLGTVYSQEYQNYTAAAAYFDTSATLRSGVAFDAGKTTEDLADAYGRYAALKRSVEEADSLLRLGRLPQKKLELVVSRIQFQRRQELLNKQEQPDEIFLNQSKSAGAEARESSQPGMFGFLNYRNQTMVAKGKAEFEIIWGKRPLVDNWRRRQAIRQVVDGQPETFTEVPQNNRSGAADEEAAELNLEAIPRTASQKERLKAERAKLYYQLGNVLFLDLNQPDSAKAYFHKVINSDAGSALHSQSMYALHELFRTRQQADSSRYWAGQIRRQFPNSKYVRLVNRGSRSLENAPPDRVKRLRKKYQGIAAIKDSAKEKKLRALAIEHPSASLAPHIHFQAIEAYIGKAKQGNMLALDGNGTSQFDMNTARWDSVRAVLAEHDSLFPNSRYRSQVQLLQEELERSTNIQSQLPSCEGQNITLAVSPGMENFLQSVQPPEGMAGRSLSGNITYSFVVDPQGQIYSYRLTSPPTSLGIEEALESAFEESLAFKPFKLDEPFSKIRCSVAFPIDQIQAN